MGEGDEKFGQDREIDIGIDRHAPPEERCGQGFERGRVVDVHPGPQTHGRGVEGGGVGVPFKGLGTGLDQDDGGEEDEEERQNALLIENRRVEEAVESVPEGGLVDLAP
jgi:hypothetical protein